MVLVDSHLPSQVGTSSASQRAILAAQAGEPAAPPPEDVAGDDTPERRAHPPLRPIGRERLLALRDAIRNGSYPSEEVVVRGLERLLGSDAGS